MSVNSSSLQVWLVFGLVAPLLEETVFRGGLQQSLLRRWGGSEGRVHANLCTALVFGASHAAMRGIALGWAVMLPAWLIGLVYQRWRRIAPCALVHAAFNLGWLVASERFLPPPWMALLQ